MERELGVVGEVMDELLVVERPGLGRFQSDGRGRAGRVVDQSQLAEEIAEAEDSQHDFLPVGGGVAYLDLALADQIEQPAGVAEVEDDLPGRIAARHKGFRQLFGVLFR